MAVRVPMQVILALGLLGPAGIACAQVYHCTAASGAASYQDTPCPPGRRQQVVNLPARGADTPSSPAAATSSPSPAAGASAAAVMPPAVVPPLPTMYACRNYDTGERYLSDNLPPPHQVPLGALGYPGQSLSRAYGANGVGVSAPELARKPVLNPDGPLIANAMVAVQDPCVPATPAQVCDELQRRFDANHRKLRMAMPREGAPYEQREQQLQAQMRGC